MVVAEHEDDGVLLIVPQLLEQVLDGVVGLLQAGQILGGFLVLLLVGVPVQPDGLAVVGALVGVAAVVLHGDAEEEEGGVALPVLQLVQNKLEHLLVGDVLAQEVLLGVVLNERALGKAQLVIDPVSGPAVGVVGMGGDAGVAQLPHDPGQGGDILPDVLLVGHTALGQEGHGVAEEELELGVGRVGPVDGGQGIAPDGVGVEVVQEGGHGLVGLQLTHHAQVGPGLVHDDDDIGQVLLLFFGVGVALGHSVHMTGGVAVGLLHHGVPDTQVEVQVVAVVLGAVVGPVADGNVPGAHVEDHRHGHDPGEGDGPAELAGPHGEGGHGQGQKEHQDHADEGIEHGVLIGLQLVLPGHVHGGAGGHDVHGGELIAPELVDQAVDHRQDGEGHRGEDHRELELGGEDE